MSVLCCEGFLVGLLGVGGTTVIGEPLNVAPRLLL